MTASGVRKRKVATGEAESVGASVAAEHVFLRNVAVGESFSGVYFLEKVFSKVARNGNKYSDLTLRDKSGSIFARYWGEVTSSSGGDWVNISATVEEYQGNKQIVVQNIAECEAPADLSNHAPTSDTIVTDGESFRGLMELVKSYDEEAKCDTCSAILEDLFKGVFLSKFEQAPASAFPCYGRVGGLLAYTVRVAEMVNDTSNRFQLSAQEKSIALAAAILHRIGAAYAFEISGCVPQETKKGALVGAMHIGFSKVVNAVNRLTHSRKEAEGDKVVDDDVVSRLMHAIVASENEGIMPMTREAIVLHGVVGTIRELSDASDFISNDVNSHEMFTSYDPITKRRFFKGE